MLFCKLLVAALPPWWTSIASEATNYVRYINHIRRSTSGQFIIPGYPLYQLTMKKTTDSLDSKLMPLQIILKFIILNVPLVYVQI